MLKSYLGAAVRSFIKHKQHFFLNLFGLSVGMAAAILVALYAQFEISVDEHQPEVNQTYRVSQFFTSLNMGAPISNYYAINQLATNTDIEDVFTLQVVPSLTGDFLYQGNYHKLQNVMAATANIQDFVALDLVHGSLEQALTQPNQIALSESESIRLFGRADASAIGQSLTKGSERYTLAAVFADLPNNTHFAFEGLTSLADGQPNYRLNNFYVYVRLNKGADPDEVQYTLSDEYNKLVYPNRPESFVEATLLPMKDIHLHASSRFEFKTNGSFTVVLICFALSLLLVCLAGFNFINISIAQSAKRAKEVGVRKALGASNAQIIVQFLTESILVTMVAFSISCVMVESALPWFNQLVDRELVLNYISGFGLYMFITALVIGLLAGAYPAFFMSAFSAKRVLSGDLQRGRTATVVRKSLLTLQAALSIALIIGSVTLQQQLNYLQTLPVGYAKSHRIEVSDIPTNKVFFDASLATIERIAKIDGVNSVSISDASLTGTINSSVAVTSSNNVLTETQMPFIGVGFDVVQTLGLELVAGRDFNQQFSGDWYAAPDDQPRAGIIITESLAKQAGYNSMAEVIGQQWRAQTGQGNQMTMTVVGVIKDLTIGSARMSSSPVMLICGFSWSSRALIVADFEEGAFDTVQAQIKNIVVDELNIFNPEINLVADNYRALYRNDERVATLVTLFSGLAIFLTCLGLFGLASFATLRKQKEIAIRKVLGASRLGIINLLAKEFMLLVALSIVIAFPLTYWLVGDWLVNFNERIAQSLLTYLMAGGAVISITWITVATVAFKAASTRPSVVLRYE